MDSGEGAGSFFYFYNNFDNLSLRDSKIPKAPFTRAVSIVSPIFVFKDDKEFRIPSTEESAEIFYLAAFKNDLTLVAAGFVLAVDLLIKYFNDRIALSIAPTTKSFTFETPELNY